MKVKHLSVILLAGISVTACGGNGKNSPDEFAVVNRPSLAIPPESALKPPRPGVPRAQTMDPGRRAFEALFPGKEFKTSPQKSSSEQNLLARVGRSEPDIRSNVGQKDVDVVKKSVILADILDLSERTLRPDNVEVTRVSSQSSN
ncbi:DUF3035 domain-containing protein [Kordiimonas aquimaris]|uniref:DUF3035 domain-containing protein n=1 Tax=Kordiimonas aquimaris TaxID=707591 RepID=UPI0021D0C91C|nr:DUF3035 domain-containing protein [Kordiimonas aquimaris]